jgi:hypothetical protein
LDVIAEAELGPGLAVVDGVGGGTKGIVRELEEPADLLLELLGAAELGTTGLETDVGAMMLLLLLGETGTVIGTDGVVVKVTGQTVVVTAMIDVMMAVPSSGQLVTPGPHWVTVYTAVV